MNRQAITLICAILFAALFLGGCADTASTKKIITTTDPATGKITTTEEAPVVTPGFFESGDYGKFLDYKKSQWENFTVVSTKKLTSIVAAGNEAQKHYTTPTEHSQGALITQMQIDRMPTAPPNDGIEPPKRLIDVADRNLTSWVGMALQGWEVIGGSMANRSSDSSMHIEASGSGSVFVGSNGNSVQDYRLSADGAGGYISGVNFNNGLDYTPITTSTSTEGSKSYGLSF